MDSNFLLPSMQTHKYVLDTAVLISIQFCRQGGTVCHAEPQGKVRQQKTEVKGKLRPELLLKVLQERQAEQANSLELNCSNNSGELWALKSGSVVALYLSLH